MTEKAETNLDEFKRKDYGLVAGWLKTKGLHNICSVLLLKIYYYNITKAKRALWLANSASTICPWVYADDVLNN